MLRRSFNGQLIDFNPEELMNKIKERKTSLFTERAHGDKLYLISVHFEEIFGVIDEDTRYFIDIVEEDLDGNQKRLTSYREHSNLTDKEVIKKLKAFIDYIC